MQGRIALSMAFLLALPMAASAASAQADANAAFDLYIAQLEARLERQHQSKTAFLEPSDHDQPLAKFPGRDVLLEKVTAGKKVSGGMIHHWRATAFVPGATVAEFLKVVQDADRFSSFYAPQVVQSRLIARTGDRLQVAMRLRYRKALTVTLDTRYDVVYGSLDDRHGFSLSRSTHVAEIADAGTAHERALPAGDDHGFLWRLNSYWSYQQEPDGLLLQCEAVSLTRDIPFGLDWAVGPFVESIPRESLAFTLTATRNALLSRRNHAN